MNRNTDTTATITANIGKNISPVIHVHGDFVRFLKVRNVKSPQRANPEDAGIDFYIPYPEFNFIDDFVTKNVGHNYTFVVTAEFNDQKEIHRFMIDEDINIDELNEYGIDIPTQMIGYFIDSFGLDDNDDINNIKLTNVEIEIPGSERILVPSGVKVWIDRKNSALIATNKSGIATKKGLVVGATTVDSTYTGEVHLSVINTNNYSVNVVMGEKLIQFIHTPVILSEMLEVDENIYKHLSENSARGEGGFGSSGLK